jgi:hypothetical protein
MADTGMAVDRWRIQDLWNVGRGTRLHAADEPIAATVPSHGAVWYALEPAG